MNDSTNLAILEEVLEAMLFDNESITARAVVRRQGSPFKNASDITRNLKRTELLDAYKLRQAELRALKEKVDKQSKTNLLREIGRLKEDVAALEGEKATLLASHRAMLLAVGEMGGMSAWMRFFASWEQAKEELRQMDAFPTAEVHTFPARERSSPSDPI